MRESSHDMRWKARPLESALLRAFIFVVPLMAALAVAVTAGRALRPPESTGEMLLYWAGLLVLSTAVLFFVERLARRLLPLAALLKLSLAFPDKVPSRMAIARRVGSTRSLEDRVEAARAAGRSDEPTKTAEAILELVVALGNHDRRTRGHAERTRVFTDLLADEMGLSASDKDRLRWASLLHDIGKLDVPTKLLNKPGEPSHSEWEVLRLHPEAGVRFIGPLRGWLGEWAKAITEHHERWDGSGYPNGLSGLQISLGARVVAVADSYEVMTAPRPYKRPLSATAAREELTRCAGQQFDPSVVRAFLNISIGRLRLAMGPISWITQLPFLPRVATGVSPVGATMSHVVLASAFATGAVVAHPAVFGSGPAPAMAVDVHQLPEAPTSPDFDAVAPAETEGEGGSSRPAVQAQTAPAPVVVAADDGSAEPLPAVSSSAGDGERAAPSGSQPAYEQVQAPRQPAPKRAGPAPPTDPAPDPELEPDLEPTTDPMPDPTPTSDPAPSPDPTPTTDPTPDPTPTTDPTPDGDGEDDGDGDEEDGDGEDGDGD